MASASSSTLTYLSQKESQDLDVDLMSGLSFSVDQLMELAGLSVASAVHHVYPPERYPRAIVVCGPGNNGGDGLVAARHMCHFGYRVTIVYPKATKKELFQNLAIQCKSLDIPVVEQLPADIDKDFDILVDGIFGFSFSGDIRAPFDKIIQAINLCKLPVIAIDIPSGWDVEKGNVSNLGLRPTMLISLTAPKLCAKKFDGPYHYLGGRFIPPAIIKKYNIRHPPYKGSSQIVDISEKPLQAEVPDQKANL